MLHAYLSLSLHDPTQMFSNPRKLNYSIRCNMCIVSDGDCVRVTSRQIHAEPRVVRGVPRLELLLLNREL